MMVFQVVSWQGLTQGGAAVRAGQSLGLSKYQTQVTLVEQWRHFLQQSE